MAGHSKNSKKIIRGRHLLFGVERFSFDLEMKTCEQNRNKKRAEIERFDCFIERIQTHVAFGWLSERSDEKLHARELSRNRLRFDVILQHDWPSKNAFSILGFSLAGKRRATF